MMAERNGEALHRAAELLETRHPGPEWDITMSPEAEARLDADIARRIYELGLSDEQVQEMTR
jgi:hypothetical protein